MTAPATQQPATQSPPPQQPPPAQLAPPPPAIPAQILAAMVLPLAGLLLSAVTAAAVITALMLRFKLGKATALFWLALYQVLAQLVMAYPVPAAGTVGAASERTASLNLARRAQFALASAGRVQQAMTSARSHGGDMHAAATAQLVLERRYFQQHLDAIRVRAIAAMRTDMAALEYGPVLGWHATLDSHTSAECRRANGRNYYAAEMPAIGFPGAVHLACRCRPGVAWPGGRLLTTTAPRYGRAA